MPAISRRAASTTGCGHDQIITSGQDGWIEPMESPEALARALTEILAEPVRLVDFGRNARKKVASQFSMESMITAYEHLYRAAAPH